LYKPHLLVQKYKKEKKNTTKKKEENYIQKKTRSPTTFFKKSRQFKMEKSWQMLLLWKNWTPCQKLLV